MRCIPTPGRARRAIGIDVVRRSDEIVCVVSRHSELRVGRSSCGIREDKGDTRCSTRDVDIAGVDAEPDATSITTFSVIDPRGKI